jgi:hypothetical protein
MSLELDENLSQKELPTKQINSFDKKSNDKIQEKQFSLHEDIVLNWDNQNHQDKRSNEQKSLHDDVVLKWDNENKHDKMMNLVKIAENKQHNIEKLKKNFAKGRKNF